MKIFNRIGTYFTETIFQRHDSTLRNIVRAVFRLLYYTVYGIFNHGTLVRSAALTLYTLMSLVPIVAVLFAIVKGFGLTDGLFDSLYGLFPRNPEIIDYITDFAENALARTRGGVMATVALLTLLWAVYNVFNSIESAFNHIWEVKNGRGIARKATDYLAIILIVPVLWVVANAVGQYMHDLLGFDDSWYYSLLSGLGAMVIIWAMFSFFYYMVPNTKVRFKSALVAGVVAGTMFLLFQWGYVYLQKWMTSYNAIYGSFAALPLFLFWLQYSWQIVLSGGELAFAHQNTERFIEERKSLHISYDQRRKILLAVMLTVVRHFRENGGAISADDIRTHLKLPARITNNIIGQLVQAGQLLSVSTGESDLDMGFAPAHDTGTLTVYSVLGAVEKTGEAPIEHGHTYGAEFDAIECELDKLKAVALNSKENTRLIDLL